MNITKGKRARAQRVVIYGPEGIGKSSLAAHFPDPLFIDTEGSTDNMDVMRMDKPTSYTMLQNQLAFVKANPTICKTLVIDTIDWAESIIISHVCARHNKAGIEDFGYGNGYTYVREEMGRMLNMLQDLIEIGINVVLTAHAQIRKFEQPDEMGSYDRWELKLGKKTASQTAPLVKEWADMVLFANYKTMVMTGESKKKKAQGGARVIYTSHHPAWDAKNRHDLPPELPMDYAGIAHIFENIQPATPQVVNIPTQSQQQYQQPVQQAVPQQPVQMQQPQMTQQQVPPQAPVQQPAQPLPPAPPAPPSQPATPPEQVQTQPTPPPAAQQGNLFQEPAVDTSPPFLPPNNPALPQALVDLMVQSQVNEEEIRKAVAVRGYYPEDMPIERYDPAFIDGILIAAWPQVYQMIQDNRLPF